MRRWLCRGPTPLCPLFPHSHPRRHRKQSKKHPRQLQPQYATQPHKRAPHRLPKLLAPAHHLLPSLLHLHRCLRYRAHCFLSQRRGGGNPTSRITTCSRRIRCLRSIHRRHQRLRCQSRSNPQRSSKPYRIHSRSVASRVPGRKSPPPTNASPRRPDYPVASAHPHHHHGSNPS